MKVFVTGAGALLGQGILRSLERSSLKPTLIAVDPSPLSAGLYWADHAELVPLANDPAYLAGIESLLGKYQPDVVLVGTDVELKILSLNRDVLEAKHKTHIVVARPEVIDIADDKYETAKFFLRHGFDAPVSALPGQEEELISKVGFPLIVKPRVGARSIGVRLVKSRRELDDAIATTQQPVIQECVGSDSAEYTAGAITFNGRCEALIVMRRDLRDGNTYRAFVEQSPELNEAVRKWAESLDAYGPANFQFRIDAQGRPKVFEINGRFSGTTPLRMLAGFNEVEMIIRHIMFNEPIRQPKLEPVTILRHWSETVVRSSEILS